MGIHHSRVMLMLAKIAEDIRGKIFEPGENIATKSEGKLILLLKGRHVDILALNQNVTTPWGETSVVFRAHGSPTCGLLRSGRWHLITVRRWLTSHPRCRRQVLAITGLRSRWMRSRGRVRCI